MRANAFDQIYTIIDKYPMQQITPEILCAQLLNSKKLKVTNSILRKLRDKVRPGVIEKLQESLEYQYNNVNPAVNKRIGFLNKFYLFNGLNKHYQNLKALI